MKTTAYSYLVIVLALVLIAVNGNALVQYTIQLDGVTATGEVVMELESNNPVNVFQGSITLPENATLVRLSDSKGDITGYEINDHIVSFSTHESVAKEREIIQMELEFNDIIQEQYGNLSVYSFSLASFAGTDTILEVYGKNLLAFETSAGFLGTQSSERIQVQGKGPVNLSISAGQGEKVQNFEVFNLSGSPLPAQILETANAQFNVLPLTLGVKPIYKEFPLIILSDSDYNARVNGYSDGTYKRGGINIIRASTFQENDGAAIVLHEIVHAFNAQAFPWNNTQASWLDEGIAKTIEHILRKRMGLSNPNLFYGDIILDEGRLRTTYYSKGKIEDLFNYYQDGESFMESWNPGQDNVREFGYAFSELFVRKYLQEKGLNGLQTAYQKFLQENQALDTETGFTSKVLELMNTNFQPCYSNRNEEILSCVQEVNTTTIELPAQSEVSVIGHPGTEIVSAAAIVEQVKSLEKQKVIEKGNTFKEKGNQLIQALFQDGLKMGRNIQTSK